jgi:hypothetical protein
MSNEPIKNNKNKVVSDRLNGCYKTSPTIPPKNLRKDVAGEEKRARFAAALRGATHIVRMRV